MAKPAEPDLKRLRAALMAAQPPLAAKGGKMALLDALADDLEQKLKERMTYRQLSDVLHEEGVIVSEHTIAAWRKKRKRSGPVESSPSSQPSMAESADPHMPAPISGGLLRSSGMSEKNPFRRKKTE